MGSYVNNYSVWEVFTPTEYADIQEAAVIDPAAAPADRTKAAKINRLVNRINTQQVQSVAATEGALGILVSEGVISGQRLAEIIQTLKDL